MNRKLLGLAAATLRWLSGFSAAAGPAPNIFHSASALVAAAQTQATGYDGYGHSYLIPFLQHQL
jgi:hypothetical protein